MSSAGEPHVGSNSEGVDKVIVNSVGGNVSEDLALARTLLFSGMDDLACNGLLGLIRALL